MLFRGKASAGRRYLQIVENARDGAKTRQTVITTLGRVEALEASGKLDALLCSGARLCETAMLVSGLRAGTLDGATARRIGAPLVFGRLWQETGCQAVINDLLAERGFAFPVERAIFATVLHRLMVSGSDRSCERWLDASRIDGARSAPLLPGDGVARRSAGRPERGDTRPAADHKDVIEETLFWRRRSLFTDLSMVLFDTTSLYFYGAGGTERGRRGKSKD